MAGNDVGNGLMSCGCMMMLVPIMILLVIMLGATIFAPFMG